MKVFDGTSIMNKLKRILFGLVLVWTASACSVNEPVLFDDAFVYLVDENGQSSSEIPWDSNHNLQTYYVKLVCPGNFGEVNISYDLIVGDGLKEGVDFKHIRSTASPLVFPDGVYSRPIRIEWLRHELDPEKDNSLTISIAGSSNDQVSLGKPGPDHIGKDYRIVKK